MTVREIGSCIATANWATYSIRQFGAGITYKDLHYSDIPKAIKDAEVFHAVPVDVSFNSVKHWIITLR